MNGVKGLVRWGKFNLVGAMGMALQLTALALFNRYLDGRYLLASTLAIELTLLHNFAWHWHYTWRDRADVARPLGALMRFHFSNGLISLVGNLALMRWLVQGAHLRVLFANGIAIACCSLVNFYVGDSWIFPKVVRTLA